MIQQLETLKMDVWPSSQPTIILMDAQLTHTGASGLHTGALPELSVMMSLLGERWL